MKYTHIPMRTKIRTIKLALVVADASIINEIYTCLITRGLEGDYRATRPR
jgi:hypothetical protein